MQLIHATRVLAALVASVALPSGCGNSATRTSTDGAANLDVPTSVGGVGGGGATATGGAVGGGVGTATGGAGGAGGSSTEAGHGGSSGGAGGGQTPDAPAVGDAPSRTGGIGGGSTTTVRGGSSGAGGMTSTGGGGATSTGGTARSGGAGGTTANAGGSDGGSFTGSGGASATLDGGASSSDGGVSACHVIDALDRTCTTDADCIAVQHTSNCCGQLRYIGLRATESTTFAANEPGCRASYPKCGCGVMPPMMDDGSMDNRQPAQVGVTCLAGTCTTYMRDCGKPCASGTTCFSCSNNSQPYAVCTTQCLNPSSSSTECPNPAFPVCQRGLAGSLAATFCTAAGVACTSN